MKLLVVERSGSSELADAALAIGRSAERASGVEQALGLLEKGHFDAVVMDAGDDLGSVRRLRPAAEWLIAAAPAERLEAVIAAGADDCLAAPVDPGELSVRLRVAERAMSVRLRPADTLELNRRLIDVMPGGFVHVRSDGSIVNANTEAQRLLGWSYDELTRRYVKDFDTDTIHEDGTPCGIDHYPVSRALATGQRQPPHVIGVRKPDGELSWIVFTAVPIHDPESSQVAGAIVTFLDITLRKQAEQALAESEARYRELVEASPDPMAIVSEGKLAFVNSTGAQLLGHASSQDLIGTPVERLVAPESLRRLSDYARRRRAREPLAPIEDELSSVDGSAVEVEIAAADFSWRGKPAMLFVARDLRPRRQAEERLAVLERQFQQAQKLESLGVLAGGIAHDFNNLLATIMGNASLARHMLQAGTAAHERLIAIETAAERAADLTRQMLAYSGRGKLMVRPVNLSNVVGEITELLSTVISKKASLECELGSDLPPIEGDPAQIGQVVMNLIVNASDALSDGPGRIRIATRAEHVSRETLARAYVDEGFEPGVYAVLEVSDTGCGMDEETRARVFDPFFTTKATGRGLGLAATLGIVRGHRAALTLESQAGRGTTFRLYFPAARAPSEQPAAARTETEAGCDATLLVIDDEPMVRDVTCRALESHGFTVLSAAGGREGIELFDRHAAAIDAVLLDMTMPDMSGAEVLQELRARRQGVRVVLCSGYAESDVLERFGNAGCSFLQKPFTVRRLLSKVQQALREPSD